MSEAPTFDFSMQGGDTKRVRAPIVDGTGAAKSLVAVQSMKFWAAKKASSTVRLWEKSLSGGIEIEDPPVDGVCILTIDPTDTDPGGGLPPIKGPYYYELEVVDSDGDVQTVLKGTITVIRSLIPNS